MGSRRPGAPAKRPSEALQQRFRSGSAEARREGEKSALRFRERKEPVLVNAYSPGLVPAWAARVYRFREEGGRSMAQLGVWAQVPAGSLRGGAVPVKLEKYGRLPVRLPFRQALPQGRCGIGGLDGSRSFVFGLGPSSGTIGPRNAGK